MVAHIGGKIMAKFKVGDRVRKINDDFLGSFSIGEELVVTVMLVISGILYYRVARSIGEETDSAYASDLKLVSETPNEITLNGATYVLKEEQKPEHEWKFGDWARHPEYGVVFVGNVNCPSELWCIIKDSLGWRSGKHINPNELTYISSAAIPV